MEKLRTIREVMVSDVSGQKMASVHDVPSDCTVGEFMRKVIADMNLPQNDVEGRPLSYQVLNEQSGQHLPTSETVGDTLQDGDRVVLHPNIDAGDG